jgi:hypothetical protein
MREEHDECAFPCDIAGCTRIGRRGYFREKDLIKHRNEQHPDALDYRVSVRELHHMCTEPGCGALLGFSSLKWHYAGHEYQRKKEEELTALTRQGVATDAYPTFTSLEQDNLDLYLQLGGRS